MRAQATERALQRYDKQKQYGAHITADESDADHRMAGKSALSRLYVRGRTASYAVNIDIELVDLSLASSLCRTYRLYNRDASDQTLNKGCLVKCHRDQIGF